MQTGVYVSKIQIFRIVSTFMIVEASKDLNDFKDLGVLKDLNDPKPIKIFHAAKGFGF